jgi:hypothetical protein
MPEPEPLEVYDLPCPCGCPTVERFGSHFTCMACGTQVDPETARMLIAPPDG